MAKSLTLEDWILVFVYSHPARNVSTPAIKGALMFTKQFFVFVKEIMTDLEDQLKFVPYHYGPYSFILKSNIDNLIVQGYLEESITFERKDYMLTAKGSERAKSLYENVDDSIKNPLEKLRNDATKLGYPGVLRYVYSRYPEYTTASKIRERVMHAR